ncbi:hypothetical protein EFK68_05035 [Pseudomonas aeruginosa]|nr:hypothetical protein EFK68_05035 [Pseudomonas aeruginosa]
MIFRGNTVIDEFAINAAATSPDYRRGGAKDVDLIKNAIFQQLGIVEIPQEPMLKVAPTKRFTTKELISLETDCLKAVYAGLDDPRWSVDQAIVDRVIDAYELEKQAKQKPGRSLSSSLRSKGKRRTI